MQTVVCKKDSPHYWAEVAISPTGKAVALVDRDGYLWGGSIDFKVSSSSSYNPFPNNPFFPFPNLRCAKLNLTSKQTM